MLTVGSRDEGRKRSVLGLEGSGGARGRNMEESEIEEGEAYSGQDNHIDPDALSYIDEKLQHVLGHFQKEFEAGVSAETLGAKFGGYGSFLPVYQRSPPVTLSQPKSPAKVPGLNLSRSPHNLQPEAGCQNASIIANSSITKANTAYVAQQSLKYGKRETSISLCSTSVHCFLNILEQVMTCFPVPGSCFLSPLSETLLHFLEKEDTLVTNIKKNTPQNVVTENFTASDTCLHAKDVKDVYTQKMLKTCFQSCSKSSHQL